MTGNVKQDLKAHLRVRFFLPVRFTMLVDMGVANLPTLPLV